MRVFGGTRPHTVTSKFFEHYFIRFKYPGQRTPATVRESSMNQTTPQAIGKDTANESEGTDKTAGTMEAEGVAELHHACWCNGKRTQAKKQSGPSSNKATNKTATAPERHTR